MRGFSIPFLPSPSTSTVKYPEQYVTPVTVQLKEQVSEASHDVCWHERPFQGSENKSCKNIADIFSQICYRTELSITIK